MAYQTPRMLARTLLMLRKRHKPKLNQSQLGALLGRSKAAISAYERRDDSMTYEMLDRYQLAFGAPNGVLLAISHTAAIARDASSPTASARQRKFERAKLELMGLYLKGLSRRILSPDKERKEMPLWAYPGLSVDDPHTWDKLLKDLFEAAQDGQATEGDTVFTNLRRLKRLIDDELASRNSTGNGVDEVEPNPATLEN